MNCLEVQSHPDASNTELWTELKVDGVLLTDFKVNSMSVGLSALEDSTLQAGEHDIVTCDCGYPMCAGLIQEIQVDHADRSIDWTVRGLGEARTFSFDPQAYRSAVQDGIGQLQKLMAGSDLEASPDINKFTYGKNVSQHSGWGFRQDAGRRENADTRCM